jgi:transcriptional regulator with XRE-family HTH domain
MPYFRRDFRGFLCYFHTTICNSEPYVSVPEALDIYALEPDQTCIGTLFEGRQNLYICNRASSIYKNQGIIASFAISRYGKPKTLGELIRKHRLENNLTAKELAKIVGVSEDTILNWEKGRNYPPRNIIIHLKERLSINPFELIEFEGAISQRQRSILNLTTERGAITRKECQEALGTRKQYAQNDLYFLYKLGVLDRTLGKKKKATYFLSGHSED